MGALKERPWLKCYREESILIPCFCLFVGDFPGNSVVKNALAMQETWVQSLGWEDHLEKEMATHSSILAQKDIIFFPHFILLKANIGLSGF